MANTLTDSATEDARGKELAERNTALPGVKPDQADPSTAAGIDQAESYANDPANATSKSSGGSPKGGSGPSMPSGGAGGVGGKLGAAVKAGGAFVGSHKKGWGIGAGLMGLLIAGIFAIFGLLTDKLASLVANIFQKEFRSHVEQPIKERVGTIVEHEAYDRILKIAANSDNPALQKLFNQIPIDKIESALKDRGYTLSAEDGKLRIQGPNLDRTFASADEFESFMSSSAGTVAEGAVEDSAEEASHFLETYQRRFLRTLMRDEFDAKPDDVYDDKTDDPTNKADPTAAADEVAAAEQNAAIGPLKDSLVADVSCITGSQSDCDPDPDVRRDADGNTPDHPTWESTEGEKEGTTAEADDGCSGSSAAAACDTGNAAEGAGDTATLDKGLDEAAVKETDNKVAESFIKEVEGEVIKGGNVVGIIGTLADVDAVLEPDHSGHDEISDMIIARRSDQYVGLFDLAEKEDSEIRDGVGVSGDEFNDTMKDLDATATEPGMEESQAFSSMYEGDPTRGITIDSSKLVDSGGSAGSVDELAANYRTAIGQYVHPFLQAYKKTIGQLTTWIGDIFGDLISKIPGVSNFTEWLGKYAAEFINYLLGTVVDGGETGASLVNAETAGGDVAANAFARDSLGAPAVTDAQAAVIDQQTNIAYAKAESREPIAQRLFNTNDPSSLVSQLAVRVPNSVGSAGSQAGSYLASIITNPLNFFSTAFLHHAFAPAWAGSDTTDPYGVQQYAYSEAALEAPLNNFPKDTSGPPNPSDSKISNTPDGQLDLNDCPYVADSSKANECLLDMTALLSLTITSTTADNGGTESTY